MNIGTGGRRTCIRHQPSACPTSTLESRAGSTEVRFESGSRLVIGRVVPLSRVVRVLPWIGLVVALTGVSCADTTSGSSSERSPEVTVASVTTGAISSPSPSVIARASPVAVAPAPPPAQQPASADPYAAAKAAGASAVCADGTWSFSKNRSGTCSSHGGVHWWTGNLGPAGPGAH